LSAWEKKKRGVPDCSLCRVDFFQQSSFWVGGLSSLCRGSEPHPPKVVESFLLVEAGTPIKGNALLGVHAMAGETAPWTECRGARLVAEAGLGAGRTST